MDGGNFHDLLQRVRTGDEAAAFELVKSYEPQVRAAIRSRLRDPAMKRHFDSIDICQSVMASFFPRAAHGQFELHEPKQLVGLLVQMARNKLAHQMRRHRQQCRDVGVEVSADASSFGELQGADLPPDRIAMAREELERLKDRLDPEARLMADLRSEGREWTEVAEKLGGTPEARRKQFQRALAAVFAAHKDSEMR
ncbi:MAG: sigma-70 family RNA polymerase sigma factor [Gemmatales bacterium]